MPLKNPHFGKPVNTQANFTKLEITNPTHKNSWFIHNKEQIPQNTITVTVASQRINCRRINIMLEVKTGAEKTIKYCEGIERSK